MVDRTGGIMAGFDKGVQGIDYGKQYNQGKDFRARSFVTEMHNIKPTTNDPKLIDGMIQGRMQCFATCFTAWARLQGLVDMSQSVRLIKAIDAALGNNGGGVVGHKDLAIEQLPVEKDLSTKIKNSSNTATISAEWSSTTEFERGKRNAQLLKKGGALILQNGGHFRLAYVDVESRINIFDPLTGKSNQIKAEEIYNVVQPEVIGKTVATVIELPPIEKPDDDFVMMN